MAPSHRLYLQVTVVAGCEVSRAPLANPSSRSLPPSRRECEWRAMMLQKIDLNTVSQYPIPPCLCDE